MLAYLSLCSLLQAQSLEGERLLYRPETMYRATNTAPQMVSDLKGGAYLVFKSRKAGRGNQLYAHRLVEGSGLFMPHFGVPVWPTTGNQYAHQIAFDPTAGLFVCWMEQNGQSSPALLRLQLLDKQLRPKFPAAPKIVTYSTREKANPLLINDFNGRTIVLWEEKTKGTLGWEVYGQLFNAKGERLWGPEGKLIVSGLGDQRNLQAELGPRRGLLLVWESYRTGDQLEVMVNRTNPNGRPVWLPDGLSLAQDSLGQLRNPQMIGDGYGGMMCVVESTQPGREQAVSRLIRVNKHGKITYARAVSPEEGRQFEPIIYRKGGSLAMFWEDRRGGDSDIFGQYLEMFRGKKKWADNGQPVIRARRRQFEPQVVASSLYGAMIVLWLDDRQPETQLYLQRLSEEGNPEWVSGGVRLWSRRGPVESYTAVDDERGGIWVVWTEEVQNDRSELFFAHLDSDGNKSEEISGGIYPRYTGADTARVAFLNTAPTALGGQYLVWEDFRFHPKEPDLFMGQLNPEGEPKWGTGGLAAVVGKGRQEVPKLALNPVDSSVVLAWSDRSNFRDENLWFQQIGPNGHLRWPPAGKPICTALRSQTDLQLSFTQNGHLFTSWVDSRLMKRTEFEVYFQRFDTAGNPLQTQNGEVFAGGKGFQNGPDIGNATGRAAWLAWADNRPGNSSVGLRQISVEGLPGYQQTVIRPSRYPQLRSPILNYLPAKNQWLVLVENVYPARSRSLLSLSLLAPTGELLNAVELLAVSDALQQGNGRVLWDESLQMGWLVWQEQKNERMGFRLMVTDLQVVGRRILLGKSKVVAEGLQENAWYNARMAGDNLLFAWEQQVNQKMKKVFWSYLQGGQPERVPRVQVANTREVLQERPQWLYFPKTGRWQLVWMEHLPDGPSEIRGAWLRPKLQGAGN